MSRVLLATLTALVSGLAAASCGGGASSPDPGVPDVADVPEDPATDPASDALADDPRGEGPDVPEAEGDLPSDAAADLPGEPGDEGPEATDWHLPALASCAPAGPACEAYPAGAFAATIRPDFFHPYETYPEDNLPDPSDGRRVQVAAVASAGGAVTRVEIRGRDVTPLILPQAGAIDPPPPGVLDLLSQAGGFHWVHVWPLALQAGQPFFLAMHLHDAAVDGEATLPVRVTTDAGVAFEAEVPMARAAVRVTYVTTTEDFGTLLIHVRNDDALPRTLARLVVNGQDLTDAACVPLPVLAPGETALWTVPLCRPLHPGDPWTVVADFDGAPSTAAAGRVILPHYPIHAWVDEGDCPFPGANWQNYLAHREKGFDMPFLRGSFGKPGCNGATAREIVSKSAHIPDQYYLLDEWADVAGLDDTRLARLLGDEVDSDWEAKPWKVSLDARRSWGASPRMTTYIGGARHRRTGAYAGLADVQGFDIYSAACAPTILDVVIPPLRAPFDYCRAVRENQAPGPHWFYSQGIAGWGSEGARRDPDALELKVAAMSVAACGSKGLMYFMTQMERVDDVPATWDAMGEVNRVIRAVREFLREGDATGGARAGDPDVLLDAIRARDAIVVPVVNARVGEALDMVRCLFEADPHWTVKDVTTDVAVDVPADFEVADLLEVVDGAVVPVTEPAHAVGRTVTIPGVVLTNDRPYRVFVLARTADVADRMRAAVPVADAGPEPASPVLQAVATCAPPAAACDAPIVDAGLKASYRKDFFYPYEVYPEASIPDPVDGGRVQAVALAAASGNVIRVEVQGRDVTALASDAGGEEPPVEVAEIAGDDWMHWIHVWPRQVVAGQPIWVAFHSGQAWLDQAASVSVRVTTDQGVALDGNFTPAIAPVPFGYVVPDPGYASFRMHLRNASDAPRTLVRLVVDGRDVTGSACIPDRAVRPGQAVMWTVPLCAAAARGDAWTAVAEWDDGTHSVAAGRVVAPHFGIHTWPSSSDCPFPGANDANWRRHWEAGFDTPFLWKPGYAGYEGCNGANAQAILSAAEPIPGQWLMVSKDIPVDGHDTDRLMWFTGDEPDGETGTAPWGKSRHSIRLWQQTPGMATYVGGSRHRHNGAFAGVTDIQGFDIYVSACAPYILDYGTFPPLRAPFDFARAVRFNQQPLPTWFYSHGMLGATELDRQPSPAELWVEALSPVAAGTKGLMYFQSNMGAADRHPASWQAIADANRMVRGVRALLAQGDPTGQVVATPVGAVLADGIRAPDALVVPVIDVKADVEMSDVRCLFEQDPHWILADVGAAVRVAVPDDLPVAEVFEVRDGAVVPPDGVPYALGRDVVLPSVMLSEARPVRLFVLAASAEVAGRVARDLEIPSLPPP